MSVRLTVSISALPAIEDVRYGYLRRHNGGMVEFCSLRRIVNTT